MSEQQRSFYFFRGRVALTNILKALGIKKGDYVATQAFTCEAVPEAILATGASPLYIDIEKFRYTMDPGSLRQKLHENVRAIVVQHTYGIPASLPHILPIAEERNIPVIEDCCHGNASLISKKPIGTFGDAAFYSFEWGKPLPYGIGGLARISKEHKNLISNISTLSEQLKSPHFSKVLRIELQYLAHKFLFTSARYWKLKQAFKFLSDMGLIVGNYTQEDSSPFDFHEYSLKISPFVKQRIKRNEELLMLDREKRKNHMKFYQSNIKPNDSIAMNQVEMEDSVLLRFPLLVENKESVLSEAKRQQIEISGWYHSPVHPLTKEKLSQYHYDQGSCPVAEQTAKSIITLPLHNNIGLEMLNKIPQFINEFAQLK